MVQPSMFSFPFSCHPLLTNRGCRRLCGSGRSGRAFVGAHETTARLVSTARFLILRPSSNCRGQNLLERDSKALPHSIHFKQASQSQLLVNKSFLVFVAIPDTKASALDHKRSRLSCTGAARDLILLRVTSAFSAPLR